MGRLAIKVDVATERGTRDGVLPLARLLARHELPAVFLFALGPDRMGRTLLRERFAGRRDRPRHPGPWADLGPGALLNGTLRPGRRIARRHRLLMRQVRDLGFEVGVAAWDYDRWRRRAEELEIELLRGDFNRAVAAFEEVFGCRPRVAGAPDWQANARTLRLNDEARLLCASDTRGRGPFLPAAEGRTFRTPQFPTTLPALDELLARPDLGPDRAVPHYLARLENGPDHLLTIRAELEGRSCLPLFGQLLSAAAAAGIGWWSFVEAAAAMSEAERERLPVDEVTALPVPGRRGRLAFQASAALARPARRWRADY